MPITVTKQLIHLISVLAHEASTIIIFILYLSKLSTEELMLLSEYLDVFTFIIDNFEKKKKDFHGYCLGHRSEKPVFIVMVAM